MMKRLHILRLTGLVILMTLLTATITSACRPSTPTPSYFLFAVRVQAGDTGEYIQDAEVQIDLGNGKALLKDITDEDGYARIPIDVIHREKPAEIIVQALGYEKYTGDIDLIEGGPTRPILLKPETATPSGSGPNATDTPTPFPTTAPTPTPSPTLTPVIETTVPPPTPSPTPSPTSVPPSPIPTLTSDIATALRGASIFAAPATNSQTLGVVSAREQVTVLGHSAVGQWYCIRDDQGVQGFVYAPWFEWDGVYELLPTGICPESPTPPPPPPPPPGTPPRLEIVFYDLPDPDKCSGGKWFRRFYIEGRGGDGNYTYYWNDQKLVGPIQGSYTFELNSAGGAIVGFGKVVSGDGQVARKGLQIPEPACIK